MIAPNTKHWIPFGTPAYVLENELQDKKPFHKWASRSHVGIYVGRSPIHSRNVALILDRTKGYVSPQFNVVHDAHCFSLKDMQPECRWRQAVGLSDENNQNQANARKRNRDKAEMKMPSDNMSVAAPQRE